MDSVPADWQLPPGVDRGLWHYVHDTALARNYDATLVDCALLEVDRAFVERHCPAPGRLIDLGCGTGRLLIPLAQRGFWVLGVDLSMEMLRMARGKAEAAGVSVHLLQANLVELGCLDEASFDYAACLFSTLGMIQGQASRRRMVAQVQRLLRPGGTVILHVHNRWFPIWIPQGRRWLVGNAWESLRGRERAGDKHMPPHQGLAELTMHLFTRREILRLVREVGFEVVEVMPLSLRADGRLPMPWWFGGLRAYGYLVAARKPTHTNQTR